MIIWLLRSLIVKMDFKKINKIVNMAKKKYKTQSTRYDVFLNNKEYFIPLNTIINTSLKRVRNNTTNLSQHQLSDLDLSQNQKNQLNSLRDENGNLDLSDSQLDDLDLSDDQLKQLKSIQNNQNLNNNQNNLNNFSNNLNYQNTQNNPPINVLGNSSQSPINIVAKNYINPDLFNYEDQEEENIINKQTKSNQLAKIPDQLLTKASTDWEPINYRGVDDSYDLYKQAKVHIIFDEVKQQLIYKVIEPILTDEEKDILKELKEAFVYVFEKIHPESNIKSESGIITAGAKRLCSKYNIKLNSEQFENITYYLERDFLGLDILEPLMHDPFIEDVSCDGLNVPIFINHLKYGPLEINRSYDSPNKLNSFIIKLAQKTNQEVSLSKPILQGALPDGSRVEAIYGKEVSEKGSSFTIRKFRAEPFTPVHLIEFGSMPSFLLAYLWLAVENKQSILVSGGTATGKTTILNALSLFVPPTAKIVSIEDTPEINLPHEHWLPLIARDSQEKSQVTMFDLLKASLRERPEYIIVGEIRGEEASILFQGMATGHAGLGTVHAEKFMDLVNRMTIAPINLPKQLLTEVKIILFMRSVKVKENMVRRVVSVVELMDYKSKIDKFDVNEFLEYIPIEDSFSFKEKSAILI
jgi:type IV secretory pathway ATPase VirB11/archaellum biosynthesis ATPase